MTPVRWIYAGVALAVIAFLVYVPQYYQPTTVNRFTTAICIGIAATGLNILTGYNGQVSIGHGGFFAIGGYTSALLIRDAGWPILATIPISAAVCFVVGALIGFPALRVKGLYLALVTLGFAVVVPSVARKLVSVDGIFSPSDGREGNVAVSIVRDLKPPFWYDWFADPIADRLTDWIGARDQWAYYLALSWGLVLVGGVWLISRSRFGRALIAVRDHEAAAATVGINLSRVKILAFALSAAYAGIAGSLILMIDRSASVDSLEVFQNSILFLVALVIGGTATVVGPMIGAFVLVFLQEYLNESTWLSDLLDPARAKLASPALFGIGLVLAMYVLPDGLVGGSRRLARRLGRRRAAAPAAVP